MAVSPKKLPEKGNEDRFFFDETPETKKNRRKGFSGGGRFFVARQKVSITDSFHGETAARWPSLAFQRNFFVKRQEDAADVPEGFSGSFPGFSVEIPVGCVGISRPGFQEADLFFV